MTPFEGGLQLPRGAKAQINSMELGTDTQNGILGPTTTHPPPFALGYCRPEGHTSHLRVPWLELVPSSLGQS
jgi:hypothetical protein